MKTVFKGRTKKGLPVVIRYLTLVDTRAMWRYINELSRERTFITYQGEKVSLKEERVFVKKQVQKIKEKRKVQLVVWSDGELIGTAAIEMGVRTTRHVGSLGISIRKSFRGMGAGSILLEMIIEEAKRRIPRLEIIKLDAFATNEQAIRLYKKFGFKKHGLLLRGFKLPRGYRDEVLMYKRLR